MDIGLDFTKIKTNRISLANIYNMLKSFVIGDTPHMKPRKVLGSLAEYVIYK